MPSTPRFSTPLRWPRVSPRAASKKGVAYWMAEAMVAVRMA